MEKQTLITDWTKVSEIELVYKTKFKPSERPVIKSSRDAYDLLNTIWNKGTIDLQEEFKVLFLNRANRVLGIYHLSKGGMTATVADIRLLFVAALKAGCISIMLSHNHPSGNLKPSRCDQDMTDKVVAGAKLLDIVVLDHLIISTEGYFSFADEGLL
jgi:DNA repair protein RadC